MPLPAEPPGKGRPSISTLTTAGWVGRARPQSLSDRLAPVTIQEQDVAERLRALIRDVPDFPRPGIVFKDITRLIGGGAAFPAPTGAPPEPYRDRGIAIVA